MTAVSSSSVATVSNSADCPPIACAIVSTPSIGDAPSSAAVITKKCSHPSACSKPACPASPIGQLGGALEAEVGLRVGVAQVVGDLATLEQHVERDDGAAGLEDAEVDDREVRQVRAAQRDLVARLDPARHQQVGDHVGEGVDLRVGQPACRRGRPRCGRGTSRRCPRGGSRGCTSSWRQHTWPRGGGHSGRRTARPVPAPARQAPPGPGRAAPSSARRRSRRRSR